MTQLHPNLYKPPIVLTPRQVAFTCVECLQPGVGQPGMKVHPGKCKRAHTLKRVKQNAERYKREAQTCSLR